MRCGDMILVCASTEFEDLAIASASATDTHDISVSNGAESGIALGIQGTCNQ